MQTPVNIPQPYPAVETHCQSASNIVFAIGVVLLICGGALGGAHNWNLIGLALIIFSSLCEF